MMNTLINEESAVYIPNKEDQFWGNHFVRKYCSNCGNQPYFDTGKKNYVFFTYCPYCGKRMRYVYDTEFKGK